MQLGFPSQLAPVLFAQALSRLLLVYSAYSVIFAELLIILAGAHSVNWPVMWAGFLVGFPGFVLWWLMFSPLSTFSASLYVAFLSGTLIVVSWAVLATMPQVESTKFLPFTLLGFALITTCGVAATVRERIKWATIGLIAANLSLFVGAQIAGGEFELDWRMLLGYGIVVIAVVLTPGLLRSNKKIQISLDNTATIIEQDAQRVAVAKQTAATLHDTLLANLAVISATKPGVLQDDVRHEIESVLVKMSTPQASDTAVVTSAHVQSASRVEEVISQATSQGLTVAVSGESSFLNALPPAKLDAVVGALGQCLTNVINHSQADTAEVVFLNSADVATITIIDGGVGFVPAEVPEDRLGLKLSVVDRIEHVGGTVKLWSDTGKGTAVIIQIPLRSAN